PSGRPLPPPPRSPPLFVSAGLLYPVAAPPRGRSRPPPRRSVLWSSRRTRAPLSDEGTSPLQVCGPPDSPPGPYVRFRGSSPNAASLRPDTSPWLCPQPQVSRSSTRRRIWRGAPPPEFEAPCLC